MTRVAFIGNSHLTAFKQAQGAIEERFPDLRLSYFGLPNKVFFQSDRLHGSALNLAQPMSAAPDQVIDPDGPERLDVDAFDLVLLTSHSFYLMHTLTSLAGVTVLGQRAPDSARPLVSRACIEDMITTNVAKYALRLRRFFPRCPHMMVVQSAFPSVEGSQHSDVLSDIQQSDDKQKFFEVFTQAVADKCRAEKLLFWPTDPCFTQSPFFSDPELARQRTLGADHPATLADYTHTNADHALTVFSQIHKHYVA